MRNPRQITIAGGGLAGLTLGIALRQTGVPVLLLEAGHYPRHRVCGEFLSGRGVGVLERLGLIQPLMDAGGRWATSIQLAAPGATGCVSRLPASAFCLSRFQFDRVLATSFTALGGELRTGTRWFVGSEGGEGLVHALGRRRQSESTGWRLFGLKAHVRGAALEADLELHRVKQGYIGLSRVEGDFTNVCGLFWSRHPVPNLARDWRETLRGIPGSPLFRRLDDAEFVSGSFCSVAGLGWRAAMDPGGTEPGEPCRIGDSFGFIPPFTGNGMSAALESAELAAEPLSAFSRGTIGWGAAALEVRARLKGRLGGRLGRAVAFQRLMQADWPEWIMDSVILRIPGVWRLIYHATR